MLLCLDIGNTHIFGGVFTNDQLLLRFRYATQPLGTADQFDIFLTNILQFNQIDRQKITAIATASVVPHYDYTIKHSLLHYFNIQPFSIQLGIKTRLNIKYKNPNEVGADKIANAIGAVEQYPEKNLLIIDMGTATTVCAITKKRDYLGGVILPGMGVSMEALTQRAAKLLAVELEIPVNYLGRNTRASIQSGLFYGQLGALKEIMSGLKQELFPDETVFVIGTGGFSQLYKIHKLFDTIMPDLVLQGLRTAFEYAQANTK